MGEERAFSGGREGPLVPGRVVRSEGRKGLTRGRGRGGSSVMKGAAWGWGVSQSEGVGREWWGSSGATHSRWAAALVAVGE